jgi:hypothetical protein
MKPTSNSVGNSSISDSECREIASRRGYGSPFEAGYPLVRVQKDLTDVQSKAHPKVFAPLEGRVHHLLFHRVPPQKAADPIIQISATAKDGITPRD